MYFWLEVSIFIPNYYYRHRSAISVNRLPLLPLWLFIINVGCPEKNNKKLLNCVFTHTHYIVGLFGLLMDKWLGTFPTKCLNENNMVRLAEVIFLFSKQTTGFNFMWKWNITVFIVTQSFNLKLSNKMVNELVENRFNLMTYLLDKVSSWTGEA